MFDKDFQSNLLRYELDYERLKFLLDEEKRSDSDEQSFAEEDGLNLSGLSLEEYNMEIASINEYDDAITRLTNAETSEAISRLSSLASKGMAHAQYALAIIKCKSLLSIGVDRKGDPELANEVSTIVGWLKSENLEKNLCPLNRSLLLKIGLYDIGWCGEKVEGGIDDLLNRVLYVTKDTKTKFKESLVEEKSMVAFGAVLEVPTTNQMNDCEIIIRCAMYELLKKKALEKGPNTQHSAIEDAFLKICRPLPGLERKVKKMFEPLRAEMIYGHAVNLLIHNQGSKDSKNRERAVELLEESFQLGHSGASYLLGTLLYRGDEFGFLLRDDQRCKQYFSNLEGFATSESNKEYNETALYMVANEYLKGNSRFVVQSEERAREILEDAGHAAIWKEASTKLLALPSPSQSSAEYCSLRRDFGRLQVESTPKRSRDERKRDEEDSSPEQQRYKFPNVGKGIGVPQSGDREDVPIHFPKTSTVKCEDMMGKTTMPSEFISCLDDQRLNNRSILLPRQEYFFLTRKGGGILDSNFSDIEGYV